MATRHRRRSTGCRPRRSTAAQAKLRAVANKIGYPDRVARLLVAEDRARRRLRQFAARQPFAYRRQMAKIGKPVDKTEWLMTPPTVNAYYNPFENNINFPAGILQPPFFYHRRPTMPSTIGAAGAVVGHELTHGFDDQGRRFDAQGNLRDWWTAADGKNFDERAPASTSSTAATRAVDDVKLNGKLTLGENTADNGGLRLAWMALHGADEGPRRSPPASTASRRSSASSSAGRRCGARTAPTKIAQPAREDRPAFPRALTGRMASCRTCRSSGRRSAARRPRRWSASRSVECGELTSIAAYLASSSFSFVSNARKDARRRSSALRANSALSSCRARTSACRRRRSSRLPVSRPRSRRRTSTRPCTQRTLFVIELQIRRRLRDVVGRKQVRVAHERHRISQNLPCSPAQRAARAASIAMGMEIERKVAADVAQLAGVDPVLLDFGRTSSSTYWRQKGTAGR